MSAVGISQKYQLTVKILNDSQLSVTRQTDPTDITNKQTDQPTDYTNWPTIRTKEQLNLMTHWETDSLTEY